MHTHAHTHTHAPTHPHTHTPTHLHMAAPTDTSTLPHTHIPMHEYTQDSKHEAERQSLMNQILELNKKLTQVTKEKEILASKIPAKQEEVKSFRKEHGKTKVGEVTVDMVGFIDGFCFIVTF